MTPWGPDLEKRARELLEWRLAYEMSVEVADLLESALAEIERLRDEVPTAVATERRRHRDYYDRIAGIAAEGQRDMNPEKHR